MENPARRQKKMLFLCSPREILVGALRCVVYKQKKTNGTSIDQRSVFLLLFAKVFVGFRVRCLLSREEVDISSTIFLKIASHYLLPLDIEARESLGEEEEEPLVATSPLQPRARVMAEKANSYATV